MSTVRSIGAARPTWFVGAAYGGTDDQTPRFLADGIWKHGFKNKYHALVRTMLPGDRIAIKACYTRKRDLPFDNHEEFVSVMSIKAVGTITANRGDGQTVHVAWAKDERPREWYFFTQRATVWRVELGNWRSDGLVEFAFDHKPQDIQRFQRFQRFQRGDR